MNYPGFDAGDEAWFTSAASVVLDLNLVVNDLDNLYINTPATVNIDLNGFNIDATTVEFGDSNGTPQPCTANIDGGGTITVANLDTAQDYTNTITLTNGAEIVVTNQYWFDQDPGTVTNFLGDGTSSFNFSGATNNGDADVIFDNITVIDASGSYLTTYTGGSAPGQTVTVTVSGTFPVQGFTIECEVTNVGAAESYDIRYANGSTTDTVTGAGTYVVAPNIQPGPNTFVFYIDLPAVLDTDGDGIYVSVLSANDVCLGTVPFIYDAASTDYIWQGDTGAATGDDWNVAGNWSTNAVPGNTSNVIIPAVVAPNLYPVLNINATGANAPATITVQSGGILDCAGYNVTAGTSITNNGSVRLTGAEIITSPITTNGPSSIVEYYGAGTVNASWSTAYRNLYLNKSGGTLTFPSGIAVSGNLTTGAAAYSVVFNGNAAQTSNIAGAAVIFNNNGTLTLGNDTGDSITFAGGLTATAPAVNMAGAVDTTGTAMSLGTVVLTAAADLDTGGGNIGIAALDGNFDVILAAGAGTVTFSGAVGTTAIGDNIGPAISSTGTGLVHFQGGLETNSGIDIDGPVRFSGNVVLGAGDTATTLDGDVTVDGVSIQSGRNITFGGNVVLSTAAVSISTTANNGNIVFNGTINGDRDITVSAIGNGDVTFNDDVLVGENPVSALGVYAQTLVLGGAISIDATGSGAGGTGDMYFEFDAITAGGVPAFECGAAGTFYYSTRNPALSIQFAPTNSAGADVHFDSDYSAFINAGSIQIGTAAHTGQIYISGTGGLSPNYNLSALNNGPVTMYGAYTAGNRNLSLDSSGNVITLVNGTLSLGTGTLNIDGPVTLAANVTLTATAPDPGGVIFTSTIDADNAATQARTLTLNPGADGVLSIGGAIGATEPLAGLTLVNTSGFTFANTVDIGDDGGFLTITDTDDTQTVAFTAGVTVGSGGLTAANNGTYNVSIIGAVNTVAGAATFANSGTVTIGDEDTDTFTSLGGVTANAPSPSVLYLAGTLNTDSAPITIGSEIILTANAVMDSEQGNDGNGGAIDISASPHISGQGGDWNLSMNSSTTNPGGDGGAVSLGILDDNGGNFLQNLIIATTGDAAGNDGTLTAAGQVAISGLLSLTIGGSDASFTAAGTAVSSLRVNSGSTITLGNAANPEAGGLVFLDPVNMTGDLSVTTTGTITDNGDITVAGDVFLVTRDDAGAAVTIDENAGAFTHDFGSLTLQTLNAAGGAAVNANITLYESAATDLALVNTGGTLTVVSAGAITDSGTMTVGGAVSFTTQNDAGADILLNELAGGIPVHTVGSVTLRSLDALGTLTDTGNLTLYTASVLDLAGAETNGTLTVVSTDAITDSGTIMVGGVASFTTQNDAGADIILDELALGIPVHTVGSVTLSSLNTVGTLADTGNITLYTVSDMDIAGAETDGTLTLVSAGDITDSGNMTVAGAVSLRTWDTAGAAVINIDENTGALTHSFGALTLMNRNDDGTVIAGGAITVYESAATDILLIETLGIASLESNAAIEESVDDDTIKIRAQIVSLTAGTGIGVSSELNISTESFLANGGDGNITVSNDIDAPVTINGIVTGSTTNGRTITFDQTGQDILVPANTLTIAGDVDSGGGGSTDGGDISITGTNGIIVSAVVTTENGTGGELSLEEVVLNTAPVLGAGNITLDGTTGLNGSLILAADLTFTADTVIRVPGDIIVRANIGTGAGPYNLRLIADDNDDGLGGILVENPNGQLSPTGDLRLDGSDLIITGSPPMDAITLSNNGGTIRIDAGGAVLLQGKNVDADISVLDGIDAGGSVTINSFRDVLVNNDDSDINSVGIAITTDSDNSNTLGAITMAAGSVFDGADGTISLSAYEDITLGRLTTTSNNAAAVSVVSENGSITNSGSGSNINTGEAATAGVILDAAGAIGVFGTGHIFVPIGEIPIETSTRNLTVNGTDITIDNTAASVGNSLTVISMEPGSGSSQSVLLTADDDVSITSLALSAGDNIAVLLSNGSLTLPNAPINVGTGDLYFSAAFNGEDVNDGTDTVFTNTWTADALLFRSGFDGAGQPQTLTTQVNSIGVQMTGLAPNSGIVINENNDIAITSITTDNGPITVTASNTAAGDITVSTVTAGNASTITITNTVNGGGSIVDNTSIITCGILDISATGSIGMALTAIGTDAATLRAAAGGDIYINETGAIQLGDATGTITTSGGDVYITAAGDISTGIHAVTDIISTTGTGDAVTLVTTAGGTMILGDTINTIGLVTLTNAGQLDVLANIDAGGGVTQNGAGDVHVDASFTTTGDNVSFATPVSLVNTGSGGGTTSINTGVSPATGDITFVSTIVGTAGTEVLSLTAGDGSIDLQDDVGTGIILGSLTVNSGTTSRFRANVTTAGTQDITAGTIQLNGTHTT
ncbi:MAG: hypothetical protein JXB03_01780, partial [Spirochaetales bacterium]|nr:hypothetical protein [Spirochaetales bacterium]